MSSAIFSEFGRFFYLEKISFLHHNLKNKKKWKEFSKGKNFQEKISLLYFFLPQTSTKKIFLKKKHLFSDYIFYSFTNPKIIN